MEALEVGDVPTVLDNLTRPVLKSIVNIIGNVLNNPEFHISQTQKRLLKPYISSYVFLLDKKQSPEDKKDILQEKGEAFLPTFLDIVGDDISLFIPVGRTRKDCPKCGKEALLKLSNHLLQVHNIRGEERKRLLQEHNVKGEERIELLKTSNTKQNNGLSCTDDEDSDDGDT